jgi:hypothetical protein
VVPDEYREDGIQPECLYPSEEVINMDDPKKPWKAYVATALTAVGTFVTYWIADTDPFTAKEMGEAALAALVASGLTGGATFATRNPTVPSL